MQTLETILIPAIVALAAAVGALWRENRSLNAKRVADQRDSSRLIFALLQRVALYRGADPPPTTSTVDDPQFAEAKKLATRELNGEIERLVKGYLETERPGPDTPRDR